MKEILWFRIFLMCSSLIYFSCGGGGGGAGTPTPWTITNLYDTTYNTVKFINLLADPNGKFHLALYDGSRGPMWAVSPDSDPSHLVAPSPIEEDPHQNGMYGLDLSLAVSAAGEPSAGYRYVDTEKKPVYASYSSSSQEWNRFSGLGPFTDAGYHTSLVRSSITGEEDDFLVYANQANGYEVTITHCTPSACDLPIGLSYQGLAFSVNALGGNLNPVLIFSLTPGQNSSLQILVCSTMSCQQRSGPVTLKTGLPATNTSTPPLRSHIIDRTVYVIFSSPELHSLKCTASDPSTIPNECTNPQNWTEETVFSDQADWISLSANVTSNFPFLVYSTGNGALKFSAYNGTGWSPPELIVSGLTPGSAYPAITHYRVGSSNFAAVIYFDAGSKRIRIATRPL